MSFWIRTKDGDPRALQIFKRHYSHRPYKDGRQPKLFVGPGRKVVLVTENYDALFVWRLFKSLDNQEGVNCSVFRNESNNLSSEMLAEAELIAYETFGKVRLYTYVNSRKIRSSNPGYCFKANGWKVCGVTKRHKLLILEKLP